MVKKTVKTRRHTTRLGRRRIRFRPTLGRRHLATGPIALGHNPPIDRRILTLRLRPKNFEMDGLAGLSRCLQDRTNRLDISTAPPENSTPIVTLDRRTQRQLPAISQDLTVQMELSGTIHKGTQQKSSQLHKVWGIGQGTGSLRQPSDFSRAL
jgi:hypothetical protein